jgi:four helix bundle protein
MGSSSELEYHLLLAKDLCYISPSEYETLSQQLVEIRKMLNAFIHKLKANC